MSTAPSSLARQVATGAAFMVVGRLAIRLISVVSTLILVRLLVPEDFGIVALSGAVFAIAEVLTSLGLVQLLIRKESVDRDGYDTAFTMNLIRCALLAILVAASAPLQAALFGEPRMGPVLMVVAATVALDGLTSIGMARLQRELRFDLQFRHQVAGKILSFLLTVVFAVTIGNYWCLVLGNLCAKCLTVPYSYLLAPHRPRLCLRYWREFFNFSKWMFGYNLCAAADGQVSNLSLGAIAGVTEVGRYSVAYQVSAAPVTELAAPIRQPLYAGYAKVQHDAGRLRSHYLQSLGLVATLTIPMSVGIALVAPEVERLALGANFAGSWPLIVLCALYVLADSFAHFTFSIFALKDRLRLMVTTYAALVLLRLPLVIGGTIHGGATGMLVALVISAMINMLLWNRQAAGLVGAGLPQALAEFRRPVVAALAMSGAVLALRAALPPDAAGLGDDVVRLAVLAGFGAAVHLPAQLLLWHLAGRPAGPERRALDVARTALRARRGALAG